MIKTNEDILLEFKNKYNNSEFRIISNDKQQSKTIEIQNANFKVIRPYIVREPNYDYYKRELEWYLSESLNVNDIPGETPKMWEACSDKLGFINSNYGWCIFSDDNYNQYEACKNKLISDPHTREAIMIYNRPSMQVDYNKNGMHDFMCCQNVQYFLNDDTKNDDIMYLTCIVNFRSNDAVFGFNNDCLWMQYVQKKLADDLSKALHKYIILGDMFWNAGSLHIYERHFKYLNDNGR